MKLQIVSDLHLEFYKNPAHGAITPAADADALILAGDIHVGTGAIAHFANWPVPVIYAAGNHEFYNGRDLSTTVRDLIELCKDTGTHFLEQMGTILPNFPHVRFLGTTFWTDYLLFGRGKQPLAMNDCLKFLADHERIRSQGRRFLPRDAMCRHIRAKKWLKGELEAPFDGKTVVVTHHGCTWSSVAERWKTDLISAGFSSDVTPLVELADLWVHGHTHTSHRYQIGKCEVIVNPRGYLLRTGAMENMDFDPHLVVEV